MPPTSKKKQPSDPWTLSEAVSWIATGDPTPRRYSQWDADKFDQAAETIYRALRGGVVKACGRICPHSQIAFPESERHQIPSEHWNPEDMLWFTNQLKMPEFTYTDIVISRKELITNDEDLEARWPEEERGEPGKRRVGRQREYDREAFWRLVCWHFQAHGVPKSQGEFVKQIGPILDLAWENLPQQPAETWLKARARELDQSRSIYEKANKKLASRE